MIIDSLEIIFLKPVFIPKLWGSQKLADQFGYDLPKNTSIGEAWLISAHAHGMSYVLNGRYQGLSLKQLYETYPQLFGYPVEKEYPLLTKILDANDNLSVQIHPNDQYAQEHHQTLGKTECWYVIDCLPKAQVILGHNAQTMVEFQALLAKHNFNKLLKYVPLQKDQFVYVPALKIHGLLAHTMVFELQQSSDITYRLYDYNRTDDAGNPRTLHLQETLDIVQIPDQNYSNANSHDDYLVDNEFFKLIKIVNQGSKNYYYDNVRWLQMVVLAGSGTIDGVKIKKGDAFILPNGYHKFLLTGAMIIMISYC